MSRETRLYVDSADVDLVSALLGDSLVHGVTTNPTILERAGVSVADIPRLYSRWAAEGAREIFFQAWGETTDDMLRSAAGIAELGPPVVVKVPATRVGFASATALVAQGVRVLVTAVYSPAQALAAASIGARYIAPYLGRLNDTGRDGLAVISTMHRVVADSETDVLAASLRSADDLVALAEVGVRHFTAAPGVVMAAFQHDVSDQSAVDFEAAVARGGRPA